MEKRVVLKQNPKRRAKSHSRIRVSGGVPKGLVPQMQTKPELMRSFDEFIESKGAKLKRSNPALSAQIDRTVEIFKRRFAAGELFDYADSVDEFINVALRPISKPYRSGKRPPRKL